MIVTGELPIDFLLTHVDFRDDTHLRFDSFDEKLDEITWEWLDSFAEGQTHPILLQRRYANNNTDYNLMLINGHHRLVAAILLGWDTIQAVYADDDSDTTWELSGGEETECWEYAKTVTENHVVSSAVHTLFG